MAEMSMPAEAALNPYTDSAVVRSSNLSPPVPVPLFPHAASPNESANAPASPNTVNAFFIVPFSCQSIFVRRECPEFPCLTYTTADGRGFVGGK